MQVTAMITLTGASAISFSAVLFFSASVVSLWSTECRVTEVLSAVKVSYLLRDFLAQGSCG